MYGGLFQEEWNQEQALVGLLKDSDLDQIENYFADDKSDFRVIIVDEVL